MSEKSILEKALLQVNTLEEAVKENAKGILSSVMKKELKELIKESDDLDEVEDEVETDVTPNKEEEDIDSTEDENDMGDMGDMNDEEDDMDMDDEDEEDDMDMDDEDEDGDMGDFGMGSDNALDMTGASDSEVLKVFKAMSDEDGIIVKKDGKNLQLKDGDDEYIIRLEESMRKRKSLSEMSFDDDDSDFSDFDTKKHGKSKFSHDDLDKYFDDEDDSDFGMKDKFDMDEMDDDMEFEIDEMDDEMEFEIDEMDDEMEFEMDEMDEMDDDMYDSDLSEGDDKEETVYEIDLDGEDDESEEEIEEASRTKAFGHKGGLKKKMFKAGRKDEINEQVSKLRKQNNEYKKALVLFKDKLNEVAVFNANLAHATRLFTEQSTTKKEKMEILKRFDSVNTITESKRLFNTIKSELDSKTPINESIDRKLKNTPSSSSSKKILSEAKAYESPQYTRMKELMNKMK